MTFRGQLRFAIPRERFPDRNHQAGGRSFYFFDFDDNVMNLDTPIYIFERGSGRPVPVSTAEFAQISMEIGKKGPYENFYLDTESVDGSFRRFRDVPGKTPPCFLQDVQQALSKLDAQWKGPSWDFFEHAVHNRRPVAVITARGHHPSTLAAGIDVLRKLGHLSCTPHYLGIYPVNHADTKASLLPAAPGTSVAALKKAAIQQAVGLAMQRFGANEHHRFGLSDDAPDNVALAVEAFAELKRQYPSNAFFVFDASNDPVTRIEITSKGTSEHQVSRAEQLSLFAME